MTQTTLHTVNKFSLSSPALQSCLRLVLPGDAVLLLEDGVYDAPTFPDRVPNVTFYALREDLLARGVALETLSDGITVIAYPEFVELVCHHAKTVSWF